jgi:hypothetical protein
MRSFEDALKYVVLQSQDIAKRRRERKDYLNSDLNAADKAEKLERIDAQINQLESDRMEALRDLVAYPPDFLPYKQALASFWSQTPAHRSVFIMTKYPDGADPQLDQELQAVIDTVVAAVAARGYHPHLAIKKKLHANLWENVECHMLACARGIAIVEERFNRRLNPNVAMEWGWMRAMHRPVTYLVEKAVTVVPADVAGLIQSRFDWLNPQAEIPQLVAQDLPP